MKESEKIYTEKLIGISKENGKYIFKTVPYNKNEEIKFKTDVIEVEYVKGIPLTKQLYKNKI